MAAKTAATTIAAALVALTAGATTASAADPSAYVRTAQSKPVTVHAGHVKALVTQAAITRGGKLVVFLTAAGSGDGERLARTSRAIPDVVSNPLRAKLEVEIKADHSATVAVLGPKNAEEPDSVLFTLRWRLGAHPSIKIIAVGT